jgi:5-methylcytosine-specific restriction endonuclease McrA
MVRGTAWVRVARTEALTKQKGRCLYCKSPLHCGEATADHKKARSRGGANSKENIAAACSSCNRTKADMYEAKFWSKIVGKKPPKKSDLMIIWATRRIWERTHRACKRIEQRAR